MSGPNSGCIPACPSKKDGEQKTKRDVQEAEHRRVEGQARALLRGNGYLVRQREEAATDEREHRVRKNNASTKLMNRPIWLLGDAIETSRTRKLPRRVTTVTDVRDATADARSGVVDDVGKQRVVQRIPDAKMSHA